jgi:hypothetical protein
MRACSSSNCVETNKGRSVRNITKILASTLVTLALSSCGGAGDTESVPCALCGDLNDLRGSIASKSGSQAQMLGWVVASFERDTGIARVGEVDNAGLYTLSKVKTNLPQTLALFTPDYILQSVLSIPGSADKTIKQFVKFGRPVVPKLINNGPIVTLQDFNGLTVMNDLASDVDGDGVPDGSVSIGGGTIGLNLFQASIIDQDLDGVTNEKDPDIDGDGIVNVLDPDDNGNGILDVFDGDANGDLFPDSGAGETDTDLYFKEGVEWIAVQFELKPKDDGTGNETTLKFTTKVNDAFVPLAVQIRGAPSLLNTSTYIAYDTEGNPQVQLWNRQLMDDGISEDSNAGDRIFAKKIVLPDAKLPRAHETIFFQLAFGSTAAPSYLEFPYIFPNVKPAAITAAYDKSTKRVMLLGNPFGEIQDYVWQIYVWDATSGATVWNSRAIPGGTKQFNIEDQFLDPKGTYKFSVIAQSLDKIPSFPAYAIHSKKYDLK